MLGCALQIRIESGIDAITFRFEVVFGKPFEQVVLHHVHKIRGRTASRAVVDESQAGTLGSGFLSRGNHAIVGHLPQDTVARFNGAVHVVLGGGIAIGGANDSGQERRLTQAEVAHVLAEISLGVPRQSRE